jgi:hypothetical protein
MLRTESEEPKLKQSSTLSAALAVTLSTRESPEPNRMYDRRLRDEPKCPKLSTLRAEPTRELDRIESELPKLTNCKTDTAEPRRA